MGAPELHRAPAAGGSGRLCGGWIALAVFLLLHGAVRGREVYLTILHTTDLHGHVLPTMDYDGRENLGGMLRVAARIEALRERMPNPIVLDCGDVFQGSPESFRTRGLIMADAFNRLGYDAWVVGNHEFDWGLETLTAFLNACAAPALAANLYTRRGQEPALPPVAPYVLLEREGVRVAVVGLTTPGIPSWSRPHLLGTALFEDSVESLRRWMPEVRKQDPDVLILAAHQGYRGFGDDHANQLGAVAAAFPEFDLILGAHTHKPIAEELLGETMYAQAGYYGIWLGVVEIVYDTVARAPLRIASRLEEMGPDIPDHPGLAERWATELAATREAMDEVLAVARGPLDPEPTRWDQSPVQQLIAAAIAESSKAEFVLHGALGPKSLAPGPVTERDLWDLVPYENTIGVALLTPAEIAAILEEARAGKPSVHRHAPYGFSYSVETGEDGRETVTRLRDAEGKLLHPRRRYRVAMNSYALASGGTRYPEVRRLVDRPIARLTMTGVDTRDAVRAYLRKHTPIDPGRLMQGTMPP